MLTRDGICCNCQMVETQTKVLGDKIQGRSWGQQSGTKKEDVFRWGGGFPREGVGDKKFSMSLETSETKVYWQDVPFEKNVRSILAPKQKR